MFSFSRYTNILVLSLIVLYTCSYFSIEDIALDTIITGGDTASHYQTLEYLDSELLPKSKIIGWQQGNYGGMPLFIFYFPILFIASSFLSYLIPLTVSFKILTLVGVFLVPFSGYIFVKRLRLPSPAPALGAIGALVFLFNNSNSMWGGNIYSTLAGEFSYQFSFALTFIFLGELYHAISKVDAQGKVPTRNIIFCVLLLALVALSHGFTLIICLLSSVYFLLKKNNCTNKFIFLFLIFSIGLLLPGTWLIQLFFNAPYTSAYNLSWDFQSWKEILPILLIPHSIAFLLFVFYGLKRLKNGDINYEWVLFVLYIITVCVICFYASDALSLPDIRFIPFVQFLVAVFGTASLIILFRRQTIRGFLPLIAFSISVIWLSYEGGDAKSWISWNYQGYEKTPMWNSLEQISHALRGDINDPRVAYEQLAITDKMGSIRAFENLPLFSGRSTLEGLYFQSSLLSPLVFYAQSLYSKEIVCPFPEYVCSYNNLKRAYDYLKLLNANQIILVSEENKLAVSKLNKEYSKEISIPNSPYEIWNLNGEFSYVEVLETNPIYVEPDNFRNDFYAWFRSYQPGKTMLFTAPKVFSWIYNNPEPSAISQIPVSSANKICSPQVTLLNEEIHITTDCPGKPHLIKVSYNPAWKVENAIGPYLTTPAFMLIYPTAKDVIMRYDNALARLLGNVCSLLGFIGIIILLRIKVVTLTLKNRKLDSLINSLSITLLSGAIFFIIWSSFYPKFNLTFIKNEAIYSRKDYQQAVSGFTEMLSRFPNHSSLDKVYYYLGLAQYLLNNHQNAISAFSYVKNFQDSPYYEESVFHIGLCNETLGNIDQAKAEFQTLSILDRESSWKKSAKEKLANFGSLENEAQK